MLRSFFLTTALVAASGTLVLTPTAPANACGGFFCNAQTQTPIFQSGERVMFVQRDDGLVTMHIEVSYQGEPTEFAWLIPVLGDPTDAEGNVLPLDQAVGLSFDGLFQRLEDITNPVWVGATGEDYPSLCEPETRSPGFGCHANPTPHPMVSNTALESPDSGGGPGLPNEDPFVEQEAKVGPYNAQLIAAPKSSDALFDWLNDNGYYQDPAARPLLAHYVSQGFKFIGIRLQSGRNVGDIKPIRLTLPEGGPCVPLRLTGIAATSGMPMRIWVLGSARAVPKNFLHAVVNEQAIQYPGGANYDMVVQEAVTAAGGRAFVTETAMSTEVLQGLVISGFVPSESELQDLASFETRQGFETQWNQWGLPRTADFNAALWESDWSAGKSTAAALVEEFARPAMEAESAFRDTAWFTRFYTRIDPIDMTRDPVFGFNAELPEVFPQRMLEVRRFQDEECTSHWIGQWDDGRRYTFESNNSWGFSGGGARSVPDAPALLRVELADESGELFPVHIDDSEALDSMLDTAVLGTPVLTEAQKLQFDVPETPEDWPNRPAGFNKATGEGPEPGEGCRASGGQVMIGYLLLTLAFLVGWRRRRRFIA